METFIWLTALVFFVFGVAALFAQFQLYAVANTLDKILKEIRLLRLEHLREAGRSTEEDFEKRAQNVMKG